MIRSLATIEGEQATRVRSGSVAYDTAPHAAGSAVRMSGAPSRITMVCS